MPYRTPGPFILVVDDDVDLRSALMMFLQEEGYRVAGASHGVEALKFLMECTKVERWPSLIFLDGQMPLLSGYELLGLLPGAREEIQRIPLCLVTGDPDPQIPEGIQVPILKKPINLDKMLEIVHKHIPRPNGDGVKS